MPYFCAAAVGSLKSRFPPLSMAMQKYKYLAPACRSWKALENSNESPTWINRFSRLSGFAESQGTMVGLLLYLGICSPVPFRLDNSSFSHFERSLPGHSESQKSYSHNECRKQGGIEHPRGRKNSKKLRLSVLVHVDQQTR